MASTNSRANKSGPRTRRLFCGFAALSSCALAAGCGAPPDASTTAAGGAPAGGGQVEQVRGALAFCPNPTTCTTSQAAIAASSSNTKLILTETKDLFSLAAAFYSKSPGSIASGIFQFVNDTFFASPPSPDIEGGINCLSEELQCVAQGLDWKITDIAWEDDQYVPVNDALMDIQTGFTTGSNDDNDSHDGAMDSGQIDMFSRVYIPSATDGDGQWKSIISNSAPDSTGNGEVFDWQGGFTRFTALIPERLSIIGYLDPNFQADGTRSAEIDGPQGYRALLQGWLTEMVNGVHCDWKDIGSGGGTVETQVGRYEYTNIACADVNSGISAEARYTVADASNCLDCGGETPDSPPICVTDPYCLQSLPDYTWDNLSQMDPLSRAVKAQLPIFEVHSMIDSLYLVTHPSSDLTQAQGRIPVASNHGLCLDVQWGNPAAGTPVWIWGCSGSVAQQWSYNRQTSTITNTAFGMCLQVRPNGTTDNLAAQAVAEISDCVYPVPLRQQWTYDPEKGAIRSALGTVLEIEQNNQQAGTFVWLADENDGPAQLWFADQTSTYCNDYCDRTCPGDCGGSCSSSCSGAGPNTGQCIGACMSACMDACVPACVSACE
jgi:Ricin-type beta-trefoil lectin domain